MSSCIFIKYHYILLYLYVTFLLWSLTPFCHMLLDLFLPITSALSTSNFSSFSISISTLCYHCYSSYYFSTQYAYISKYWCYHLLLTLILPVDSVLAFTHPSQLLVLLIVLFFFFYFIFKYRRVYITFDLFQVEEWKLSYNHN